MIEHKDLKWFRQLLKSTNQNGLWISDNYVCRIDHEQKQVIILERRQPFDRKTHLLDIDHLAELGYTLKTAV